MTNRHRTILAAVALTAAALSACSAPADDYTDAGEDPVPGCASWNDGVEDIIRAPEDVTPFEDYQQTVADYLATRPEGCPDTWKLELLAQDLCDSWNDAMAHAKQENDDVDQLRELQPEGCEATRN